MALFVCAILQIQPKNQNPPTFWPKLDLGQICKKTGFQPEPKSSTALANLNTTVDNILWWTSRSSRRPSWRLSPTNNN